MRVGHAVPNPHKQTDVRAGPVHVRHKRGVAISDLGVADHQPDRVVFPQVRRLDEYRLRGAALAGRLDNLVADHLDHKSVVYIQKESQSDLVFQLDRHVFDARVYSPHICIYCSVFGRRY